MPHDFEHTPPYKVRILPFRESVGPDGMMPFTIYERKGRRDDVIAVQIDRKIHYSTDERLLERKREAFWGIKARAADWVESHQIIAEAIKAQGRELGYEV